MTEAKKSGASDQPADKADPGLRELLRKRDEVYARWNEESEQQAEYQANLDKKQAEMQRKADANRKGA